MYGKMQIFMLQFRNIQLYQTNYYLWTSEKRTSVVKVLFTRKILHSFLMVDL